MRITIKAYLLSSAATLLISSTAFAQQQTAQAQQRPQGLEEIVVTATRRAEALSEIPMSVSAMSIEQLERQGVKNFDDIVKFTPGLNLSRGGNGANQIAIRGISSQAGSATTGVYIDDVPIQVRNLDFSAGTLFPAIFDLERVEILRGPQGTLFGAGSEGGTIRFIQPEPGLEQYSGYVRADINQIQSGGTGYELGVAHGGPIIDGKLGFRASALFKREPGWIDRVTGEAGIRDATGLSGTSSTTFLITGTPFVNSNWDNTLGMRGALKLAASDDFSATLSTSYQNRFIHDGTGGYWPSASNVQGDDFATPVFFAGNEGTNPNLSKMVGLPELAQGREKFYLPSLTLEYDNGTIGVTSVTGYFNRKSHRYTDFTRGYGRSYAGIQFPRPGDKGVGLYRDFQKNWTQEVRVQSTDDSRLQWLGGVFYSRMHQTSNQDIYVNFLEKATLFGVPANGAPFGPGTSSFINYFGMGTLPNSDVYYVLSNVVDKQVAGFAEATYEVFDRLKVTAGVRYGNNKSHFTSVYDGPENVLNAPAGRACVPNSNPCIPVVVGQYKPGEGPFKPELGNGVVDTNENVFTPKISVALDVTEDAMVYATVAKGYRQGGGQIKVPGVCNEGLGLLGYTTANGTPYQPLSYGSDSVWNYELGTKSSLMGGNLYLDGSAYYIKWNNIQQRISVPICGYAFVDNLVSGTSKGFDMAINYKATDSITLGTAFGYNKATLDKDIPSPTGGLPLFYKGQPIVDAGAPWTVTLNGQYDFALNDETLAFVRVDYSYTSEQRRIGARDPRSRSYVAGLPRVPARHIVNTRVGTTISDVEVALYVSNLLNSHPETLSRARNDSLWTGTTITPRTVGMTASYRY